MGVWRFSFWAVCRLHVFNYHKHHHHSPFPRLLGELVQPDTEELAPAVRQQVDELPPIESLPPGQSTFWLEMGRNQLGLPIQVGACVV